MRKFSVCLLFVLVAPCYAQVDTVWQNDPRQLACSPNNLRPAGTLTLKFGSVQGRELGVRRHSDNTWYFLIVANAPKNAKTIMAPEVFMTKKQVDISAFAETTEWETGIDVPVFATSGTYSIYVSDNLESEDGGYVCTVHYGL